jgi:adenosylcobinamide kinase/adenosylcobinamide-phosphate guanylyltransferase
MTHAAKWRRVLVLGGTRSGKSAFAEKLVAEIGGRIAYVATATAGDGEMSDRIAQHRARRPEGWATLEAPTGLAVAMRAAPADTYLVEDLTLLLSNLFGAELQPSVESDPTAAARAVERALSEIQGLLDVSGHLVVVSNEVGMGIVPPYPLGREFRDAMGRVNQAAAACFDEVYFVIAGLPLTLKAAAH